MERLFGRPLLNFFIPDTLRSGAPEMSLSERLLGYHNSNPELLGVIPYYTLVLMALAALISTYYIIYAGYLMFTAFGNEAKYTQGRKTLIWAMIGLAISLLSVFIVQFVFNILAPNFTP